MYFYVPKDKVADYRARARAIPPKEWKALLDEEGFAAVVAHAYGPRDLVVADLKRKLKTYSDQYVDVGLALARFREDALPLVLAQAERVAMWPSYAESRLPELGPVDAAEIAMPIARLLSEKKLAIKKGAEAWLIRHPKAALAGLALALDKRADEAPVAAALSVLAKAGHGAAIRELLDGSPAAAKNKVFLKAASAGGGAAKTTATTAAKKKPSHRHVGWVYYRAHHASPLVVGDLDVMKDWKGDDGGDFAQIKLPKGKVVTCDLDLQAPNVFLSAAGDEVVLIAAGRGSRSLLDENEEEPLLEEIARPLKKGSTSLPLTIRSGALVVSIAYNATPAKGAPTKHRGDTKRGSPTTRRGSRGPLRKPPRTTTSCSSSRSRTATTRLCSASHG